MSSRAPETGISIQTLLGSLSLYVVAPQPGRNHPPSPASHP
ncbi:MAG: hypothetical protein QXE01_12170 [Sulfolobales archaeon]